MRQRIDWQEVVDRKPTGYMELNDGESEVLHGPIESIVINEMDYVEIKLKWMARMPILPGGIPNGEWEVHQNQPILFPNLVVPFVVEDTPEKGERVRFGLNIIYFNEVGFGPERVKGLTVPV